MKESIIIRQEKPSDYQKVFDVVRLAFEHVEFSDHKEHHLVERLRSSAAFLPELSLVAELEDKIVGHILLTKIKIKKNYQEFHSLALAPVSVLPANQKQGIGGALILRAHDIARKLNYHSVFLVGHATYYPKFGYLPADNFSVEFPFDAPRENCMACELIDGGLSHVSGIIVYAKEFGL